MSSFSGVLAVSIVVAMVILTLITRPERPSRAVATGVTLVVIFVGITVWWVIKVATEAQQRADIAPTITAIYLTAIATLAP